MNQGLALALGRSTGRSCRSTAAMPEHLLERGGPACAGPAAAVVDDAQEAQVYSTVLHRPGQRNTRGASRVSTL